MATLPVYQTPLYNTRANIHTEHARGGQTVNSAEPVARAAERLGNAMQNVAEKWLRTQSAEVQLDAKNKLAEQTQSILDEANAVPYTNEKDLNRQEQAFSERLDKAFDAIVGGIDLPKSAQDFSRNNQISLIVAKSKLAGTFRRKYIDNNNANLIKSEYRNRDDFTTSGNPAFKDSYKADLESSYRAGYIDKETMTKRVLDMDKWNFARASYVLDADASQALREADSFGLNADDKKRLVEAAALKIKQQRFMDGLNQLVERGSEGNRLFDKYADGSLTLADIQENDKISENEKNALMRLSGFSEKSGKGGGLTLNFGSGRKNAADPTQAVAARLELDDKIEETINSERLKVQHGKGMEDLLNLRDDVYGALEAGYITKEQAHAYLNGIIGTSMHETRRSYSGGTRAENPYVEGMKAVDEKLKGMGVQSTATRASVHGLVIEGMARQLQQENPNGAQWEQLDAKTRERIMNGAVSYAVENVPNVNEANSIFSMYLPSSVRQDAQDSFISQWNKDMDELKRRELAKQVVSEQTVKVRAKTDLAVSNATYSFTDSDSLFLSERGYTPQEVIYTAQARGLSIPEVLEKLRGKK